MLSLSTLYIYIYIYAWLRLIRISIWCLIKDLATGFTLWHVVSQHSSATSITMEFWTQFMDKGAPGTNVYTESEDAETHSIGQQKEEFQGPVALDGLCATPFDPFRFTQVSSCLTIFPMASSDQLQLFIPQPLSNMDMMDAKIMHMHHVSTIIWISSCVRGLKFNLLDQQLGAFSPWLVCCIFTQQSRVWTRTWGRIQTGHHCDPKQ